MQLRNPENRTKYKKDYWKFNADLLKDEEFIRVVRNLIGEIKNDMSIQSCSSRREELVSGFLSGYVNRGEKE